jgi:hypothetical protein
MGMGDHRLPEPQPREEDMAAILDRVVRRTAKLIVSFDEDLDSEADALAALQAAEVERRQRYPEPFQRTRGGASLDGFSLHASPDPRHDRDGRERLCRYTMARDVRPAGHEAVWWVSNFCCMGRSYSSRANRRLGPHGNS